LKNRMSDLGRKPNIIEAERSKYDRSVLDNMGKEGLATARDERQRVDSTFKNQVGLESLQRQNDAAIQKSDPNSAESVSAREFIKNTIPGASKIRGIDQMSASQLEKLSPNLYKQSLADKSNATKIQIAQIGAGSSKEKAAQAAADKASAASDKAEAKAESRYVPGVGTAITDMDAKTIKDAAVMKDKFDRSLQEMIDLRTKHNGGAILNREDVERGKQLSKDLLLTYKDMAKLGVLSVADEKILNAIIPPDPLAYKAVGIIGQDPIMSNLKKLKGDTAAQYEKSLSVRLKDRETPSEKAPERNLVGKIIINKKTGKRFVIGDDGVSMTPADDQIGGIDK